MSWKSDALKRGILLILCVLLLLAGLFVFPKSPVPEEAEQPPRDQEPLAPAEATEATDTPLGVVEEAVQLIKRQEQTDAMLLAELESGTYTLEDPFVIVDPYDLSPLSALALFSTQEPVQIRLYIQGKTPEADVEFTFDEYRTEHQIPIYGLYAGEKNQIMITALQKNETETQSIISIETDPLADALESTTLSPYIVNSEKYAPGLNFQARSSNQEHHAAFDINGSYRWFLSDTSFMGSTVNYNQGKSLLIPKGIYATESNVVLYEMNLLGKILNLYLLPYGVHHDYQITNQNTLLVLGIRGETVEDNVYEIDLKTGRVIRFIDYKEIIQRSRMYGVMNDNTEGNRDWMHVNSVTEYQGDIIVSSNFQSAIIRNSREGEIKWILSDPKGYYAKFLPYLLKPIGVNFEYPYNQHAAEILPDYDNNPDTVDILLFDNGTSRHMVNQELQRQIKANEVVKPSLYSRMVHYRVNEKTMTVEQIWQYGKERPELFSSIQGDADLLDNGNVLGCFDVESGKSTVYTEVDPKGDLVWECFATDDSLQNFYKDYRVERLPLYTETAYDLKIGVPANNLIPKEMLTSEETQETAPTP